MTGVFCPVCVLHSCSSVGRQHLQSYNDINSVLKHAIRRHHQLLLGSPGIDSIVHELQKHMWQALDGLLPGWRFLALQHAMQSCHGGLHALQDPACGAKRPASQAAPCPPAHSNPSQKQHHEQEKMLSQNDIVHSATTDPVDFKAASNASKTRVRKVRFQDPVPEDPDTHPASQHHTKEPTASLPGVVLPPPTTASSSSCIAASDQPSAALACSHPCSCPASACEPCASMTLTVWQPQATEPSPHRVQPPLLPLSLPTPLSVPALVAPAVWQPPRPASTLPSLSLAMNTSPWPTSADSRLEVLPTKQVTDRDAMLAPLHASGDSSIQQIQPGEQGTGSNRSLGRGSVTTALISHALRAVKTDLSNRRDQPSVSDTHGCLDGICTNVLTPADESCQWRSSSGHHWYQVASCAVKRELPDCTYAFVSDNHGVMALPKGTAQLGFLSNPSSYLGGLGAPGSPYAVFSGQSPTPFILAGNAVDNLATGLSTSAAFWQVPSSFTYPLPACNPVAAAAAALNPQLPSFYYHAAAVGGAGSTAANRASLQAALNRELNQNFAAQQQQQHMQQQLLQASLSAVISQAAANSYSHGYPSTMLAVLEPMALAGGSLNLDGGLQQQQSAIDAAGAVLLLQQQQRQQVHTAAQLRCNLSPPADVAAQMRSNTAAAADTAQPALQHGGTLSSSALSPLPSQMGRLRAAHSADSSHLDAAELLGVSSITASGMTATRSKSFLACQNREPKIVRASQPMLNARQHRALRRTLEHALQGLRSRLKVSKALLQRAEVLVTVPNISCLTALEEFAAAEAEKELAAENVGAGDGNRSPTDIVAQGEVSSTAASAGAGSVEPTSEELAGGADSVDSLTAPASPVGSSMTCTQPSNGRSTTGVTRGNRNSSSGNALPEKPPEAVKPASVIASSFSGSENTVANRIPAEDCGGSQLEGITIAGLTGQLSFRKEECLVGDKVIRDLQVIQRFGALKAPS